MTTTITLTLLAWLTCSVIATWLLARTELRTSHYLRLGDLASIAFVGTIGGPVALFITGLMWMANLGVWNQRIIDRTKHEQEKEGKPNIQSHHPTGKKLDTRNPPKGGSGVNYPKTFLRSERSGFCPTCKDFRQLVIDTLPDRTITWCSECKQEKKEAAS